MSIPILLTLSVGHCALSESAVHFSVRVFKKEELKLYVTRIDSVNVREI